MLYTTFRLAKDANACIDSYRKMGRELGIIKYGKDTPIPLTKVLEVCRLNDALWTLRCATDQPAADKLARIFACDCAWRVLPLYEKQYPNDKRIRDCIETTRRFLIGEASKEELESAESAARSAVWSAEIEWQTKHLKELLLGD